MSRLVIPLAQVGDKGFRVDVAASGAELRPQDARELAICDVHVVGALEEIGGDYLFQGTLEGSYRGDCGRCLKPAETPFSIEVCWTFQEGAPEPLELMDEDRDPDVEDEESVRINAVRDDAIDLAPLAWEEIALATPLRLVCREDCRGLCPKCGADLNEQSCNCAAAQEESIGNKGLAGLAEMFPDLKPKNGKE